jgi:HEPN domain-containing protein
MTNNDLVKQWVKKAGSDLNVAVLLSKYTNPMETDVICFHCQQCVEKF